MIRPVSSIGVLPDELNADWALDVVSDVKQLAANNTDVVLLETGLGLGWGRGRLWGPLDRQWLFLWLPLNLLLLRRGRCFPVTLWRALLWWGQLLVLWLLLLVLDGLLGCISDPAKVVHDTTLGLVATGHTAGLVLAGVALAAGGLRLLKCLVVSAAEVSHLFFGGVLCYVLSFCLIGFFTCVLSRRKKVCD